MSLDRLRAFVGDATAVADAAPPGEVAAQMAALLARLVAADDWLPDPFRAADPVRLSAVSAALRPARAVLPGQLRLGRRPADADP